jgi:hypothetical protein
MQQARTKGFDVPAGLTKNHPMQLNHRLNGREHLVALGFRQERSFLQRLSLRKEEKFFFRKLGPSASATSAAFAALSAKSN